MSSQTDLDQGGTFRQIQKVYLGPSVGWVSMPNQTVVSITTVGTTDIARGMNCVLVNVAGLATIQLPSSLASPAGPQAIPNQFSIYNTVVMDLSSLANDSTRKITILPYAGELIDGLASIEIVSPYGAFVLRPLIDTGGWTLTQ